MSKHIINGFITYDMYGGPKSGKIGFQTWKPEADDKYSVAIREHSIEVEIDDRFDPTALQIKRLQEMKELARLAFATKMKEIDDQIASLQAIEYTPAVTTAVDDIETAF